MIVSSELAEEVDALLGGEPHYLSILAPTGTTAEAIDRYMYGPALVTQLAATNGHTAFVALVTKHYAQSTADRLGSGLFGARVHESRKQAVDHLAELMF